MTVWRPDVLGEGFEQCTLDLGRDEEGPVVATLVRSLPAPRNWWHRLTTPPPPFDGIDVLYLHGWSDYFFQRELAEFWTARGARFFAVDLRKVGRSHRSGQTYGFVADLRDYDADIDAALRTIAQESVSGRAETGLKPRGGSLKQHDRTLILLGHSTGGLVASLWAARHPGVADALILNSPWLEFQLSSAIRRLISPLVDMTVKINPRDAAPQLDLGFYSRAQREIAERTGPFEVNLEWRPEKAMPIRAGWLKAILAGHDLVSEGLGIEAPVCVLLSQRSVVPTKWSEDLTRADTVLVVDEIAKAALHLGSSVTIERIDDALHDVFLSHAAPRADAYSRVDSWVRGFVASRNR